ncbi:protein kinase [Glycomyces sp. NPDC048151]|uniref:protein kinase domain-containing protein n=1 Tax=Glycomyces sp. NPDC048151 TaxID=3364002 RepID=UPI00371A8944
MSSSWRVGATVADVYEVTAANRTGLTAAVFRVRHRDWRVDLAAKVPYRSALGAVDAFEAEARAWMALEPHPNVVSGVYVRRLDEIPVVFTEWMDGGTARTLVGAVDPAEQAGLLRWLDVGVQAARGVGHAHRSGLAHRDVKPDNLMLGSGGIVRVTDFGSSNLMAETGSGEPGGDLRYCSPEQRAAVAGDRSPVGPHTDAWSWAATMAELALGLRPWGDDAPHPAAILPALAASPLPRGAVRLLAACLDPDPGARPDLASVALAMREAWEEAAGEPYPRPETLPGSATAEWLSNRALSYGDLGEYDKATEFLRAAVAADPHDLYAVYNNGLVDWRSGNMTDEAVLADIATAQQFEASWHGEVLLGFIHLERGDRARAREHLDRARQASPDAAESRPLAEVLEAATADPSIVHLPDRPEGVTTFAVDAGATLLLAGPGGSVEHWDTTTGRLRSQLHETGPDAVDASMSLDSDVTALLYSDDSIELWNGAGAPPTRISWAGATSLAVSECGRFLAVGERNGTISVVATDDRGAVASWHGHAGAVHEIRLSVDAEVCTSASFHEEPVHGDGTVDIWSARDGALMANVPYPGTGPGMKWRRSEVVFDRYAGALAMCPLGSITVFDTVALERVSHFTRQQLGYGRLLALHAPTAQGLYYQSHGVHCYLDVASGRIASTVRPEVYEDQLIDFTEAAFSGDGSKAVLVASGPGGGRRSIRIVPTEAMQFAAPMAYAPPQRTERLISEATAFDAMLAEAEHQLRNGDETRAAARLRDARDIPGRKRDPRLRAMWRQLGRRRSRTVLTGMWQAGSMTFSHTQQPAVAISPSGDLVAVAELGVYVRVAPFDRLAESQRLTKGEASWLRPIRAIAFSGDEDAVMALHEDASNSVETLPGQGRPASFTVSRASFPMLDVVFYAGVRAAVQRGGGNPAARCTVVVNSGTGGWTVPHTYFDPVLAVGQGVLLVADVGSLTAWDLETRAAVYTVSPVRMSNMEVPAVSVDGGRIALQTPSGFKAVDTASGATVFEHDVPAFDEETGPALWDGKGVECMAFSAEARFLATGCRNGLIELWDLDAGARIWSERAHGSDVSYVAGSADFGRLISRDRSGVMRLWELDWELPAVVNPTFPQAAAGPRLSVPAGMMGLAESGERATEAGCEAGQAGWRG